MKLSLQKKVIDNLRDFRYHAIKHPIKYSQKQASGNYKPIILAIVIVWIISLAVGLPIIFGLKYVRCYTLKSFSLIMYRSRGI